MRKFTLLLIASILANGAMGEIVIEKLWESTTNIPAAADAKQGAGYDGTIYLQDKGVSKIYAFKKEGEAINRTEYAASGTAFGFALDDVGNMAVRDGYFASGTPNALKIIKKGETTARAISFSFPSTGRADYNSASGDFFSPEGGYVYFYCTGMTTVNYVKICNGGATNADVTIGTIGSGLAAGTSTAVLYRNDSEGIITQIRSGGWQKYDGSATTAVSPAGLKNTTLGACLFKIKDGDGSAKEIWAYNTGAVNYNSEFKVRNMTDGADIALSTNSSTTIFMIGTGTGTSSAYANWLTASKIDDSSYYIHQILPGVGIALYRVYSFTPTEVSSSQEDLGCVIAREGRVVVTAQLGQRIEVFDVMGQKVRELQATAQETSIELEGDQIYLVRVGAKVVKIKL